MILLGVKDTDSLDIVPKLADKCAGLRIPGRGGQTEPQRAGPWVFGAGGEPVHPLRRHEKRLPPQLYQGRKTAPLGGRLRAVFGEMNKQGLKDVQHGEFGADMQVSLVNEGPCTIIIDTDEWKKKE